MCVCVCVWGGGGGEGMCGCVGVNVPNDIFYRFTSGLYECCFSLSNTWGRRVGVV